MNQALPFPPENHPASTPPAGPAPARPSVGWTEIGVGAVAYLVLLVGGALLLLPALRGLLPTGATLGILGALSALGAVAIALAVRVRSFAAAGLRRVRPRAVLVGVAVGVGARLVAWPLNVAYHAITGDHANPQAALLVTSGVLSAVIVVAANVVFVPLGEEMFFRGILFGALRRYGSLPATAVSAVVFALAHGSVALFLPILVLGAVNAVLYDRTRSIWPSVAAHGTFNLAPVLVAVIAGA